MVYIILNIIKFFGDLMKLFKRLSALILCAVIMLSSAACSDSYKDAYIYFELENLPSTLDPQLVSTRDEAVIVRCLFDTLLRYDETGNLVPSAASSYIKDGLSYTFEISPDAYWYNGEKLTAHDFVFAFRRAVDPKTASSAAATLSSIQNAQDIIDGKKSVEQLSVKAESDDRLVITLINEDEQFLNTLTTPVAMPCNEKFFSETQGKYGLNIDSVLCCGSYYIRKWPTDKSFLIRLAKNLNYKGYFEARSMRVYFTCDDENNVEKLSDNNTDLSFIDASNGDAASKKELSLFAYDDTVYMLFLSPNLDKDIRSALIKSINMENAFFDNYFGTKKAYGIAPPCLNENSFVFSEKYSYSLSEAQTLYNKAIIGSNGLSLNGITIKCYNNNTANDLAKNLAAHWQQNLGAFVNLEEYSSLSTLKSSYSSDNYSLIIMPLSAVFCNTDFYISQLKTTKNTVSSVQQELGDTALCYPLFTLSSYVAAVETITNLSQTISNGIPDIALIIKKE